MRKNCLAILVVILILDEKVTCHTTPENEASNSGNGIVYIDHLLGRYSRNSASLDFTEVVSYLDSYYEMIKSMQYTASDESENSKLACFKTKLDEFVIKLNSSNVSTIESISSEQLLKLNTFLVANLDICFKHQHHHDHGESHSSEANETADLGDKSKPGHVRKILADALKIPKEVYIYASVSIIAISVLGVVCVAIVPVLNKCCFDYLFQFLTALALGTLCGDALFHLIPHVFVGHAHEDSEESYFDRLLMPRTHHGDHESSDQHSAGIYKGVAVFAGIYIFFIIETLLQITKSGGSQAKNKPPPRPVSLPAEKIHSVKYETLETKRKASADSFDEFDELIVNLNSQMVDLESERHKINMAAKGRKKSTGRSLDSMDEPDVNEAISSKIFARVSTSSKNRSSIRKERKLSEKKNSAISKHGHSHGGGDNIKTSLWMVIFGDCLHNFSDGLAIGASFTTSMTTGFGTTMAIFFHELPHEIGDFAVLRKNGVSIQNAVLFNVLSSVLSFFGCLVGLVIGSIESLSNWSFLVIAGTFIYISLVDLIPELHEFYENSSKLHFVVFIIQNIGIIMGAGIMLTIAIYENDLINLMKTISAG